MSAAVRPAGHGLKQSTLREYGYLVRNHLLPTLGRRPLHQISRREIERWQAGHERTRTAGKALMVLGAILRYAERRELITQNPIDGVERHPVRCSGDYDMYSREEVDAIIRQAADEQDAAIILTAALTGLRGGELLALRWRDIDFPGQAIRVRGNLSFGEITTPKSGKVRVVPMVDEVAHCLARLNARELQTADEDPVRLPARRAPRPQRPAAALRRRRPPRRTAHPAVSFSAALLWLDGRQQGVARAGPGVDGPGPHPDHRPLPAPPRPTRRSISRARRSRGRCP